jgi:hypothetical protein
MYSARKRTQKEFDEDVYDADLLEFRRRAEEAGLKVQIPRRDATWKEPRPVRVKGTSLTETLIRIRRGEL